MIHNKICTYKDAHMGQESRWSFQPYKQHIRWFHRFEDCSYPVLEQFSCLRFWFGRMPACLDVKPTQYRRVRFRRNTRLDEHLLEICSSNYYCRHLYILCLPYLWNWRIWFLVCFFPLHIEAWPLTFFIIICYYFFWKETHMPVKKLYYAIIRLRVLPWPSPNWRRAFFARVNALPRWLHPFSKMS